MIFPLEKILTMSARDYCEMYGKKLSDFEAKGIHYSGRERDYDGMTKEFIKIIPYRTEVVVGYRFSVVYTCGAAGTALIPKEK